MKNHLSPVTGMRLALEPRIVFDGAMATLVPNAEASATPEGLSAPETMQMREDAQLAFTGANAISVDFGGGHNVEAANLFSMAVSNGVFVNAQGSLGSSVALGGATQADVVDFLAGLKFKPDADFNGMATLTVNAEVASGGGYYSQVIDILIAPVADIVADTLVTYKGTTVTANLLIGTHGASEDRFEGTPVITSVTQGAHGTVTFSANGEVSYKPTGQFTGSDSFSYTVTSGGVTETAVVSVTVKPPNVPTQIGGATSGSGMEDDAQPVTGTVVATDANGLTDGSIFLVTTQPAHGVASIHAATGAWTYTPHADFNGSDEFTISITDDAGNTTLHTINLMTIAQVDVVNDIITTAQDTPAVFNVLTGSPAGNADSFEDASRAVTAHSDPLHGSVEVSADGGAVYTPASGYSGPDSFTYTVTSGGVTETAVVHLQVESAPPVDVPPIVSGGTTGTGTEDAPQPITGTVVATDANGLTDGSIFLVTTQPAHGVANIHAATGAWTYTPHADFNGSDEFTISITDDAGNTSLQAISLLITPQVDVVSDTITTAQDTVVVFNLLTGLPRGNADNFEDAARAVTAHSHPLHGSVQVSSDGSAVYTPASGYSGPDSFSYTVTSGGVTETGSVVITVSAQPQEPQNTPPTNVLLATVLATEDLVFSFTGSSAISVTDPDNNVTSVALTVTHGTIQLTPAGAAVISSGANGSAALTISGSQADINNTLASLAYAPEADYYGVGSAGAVLVMTTTDAAHATAVGTVNIGVQPVTDIAPDALSTDAGAPVIANLLTGDNGSGADSFEGSPVISAVTQGAHGSVSIGQGGAVTYVPEPGFSGADSFSYTVISGGVTETALVNVAVNPLLPSVPDNSAPINIVPPAVTAVEDEVFSFTQAHAIRVADAEGNVISVRLTVTHGTLDLTLAGGAHVSDGSIGSDVLTISGTQADINDSLASLAFSPTADDNRDATLSIVTSDAGGLTAGSSVTIALTPVVDIAPDALATPEGLSIKADLIQGSNGAGADSFEGSPVVSAVTQGAHGRVEKGEGGSVIYTPHPGFSGIDSFSYTVTSGGVTETASVSVTVTVNAIAQMTATSQGTGTGTALNRLTPAETAPRIDPQRLHFALQGGVIAIDPGLFVLPVVEGSHEAAIELALRQNDALTPDAGSPLADPFGLPAPQTAFVSPVQQATQEAMQATMKTSEKSAPDKLPKHRGAEGFTTQLRSESQSIRSASHPGALKAQRAVPNLGSRSEHTISAPSRKP